MLQAGGPDDTPLVPLNAIIVLPYTVYSLSPNNGSAAARRLASRGRRGRRGLGDFGSIGSVWRVPSLGHRGTDEVVEETEVIAGPVTRIIHGGDDVQAELAVAVGIHQRIFEYLRKRRVNSSMKIKKMLATFT